ncbi:MAG: acetolactate synthase large subunit [Dehalococcoidia bacterium]|nr:acetolactate synthase large subunit [Dehalococcoidia bacterium]
MNVSELFVRCLENEGVKYVFGLPGEENLDLMDALSQSQQVTFVTTRHEQGAAFMANVYGRLSTYPGVCLATLGPGATNLITGVADAQLDRAPLVAITGQAGRNRIFKESHQYLDVMALFKPITKWNARVELPETVPEIVRRAFRLARLEKPGATHIELPEDVAEAPVEGEPMPVRRTTYPVARPESISLAVDLLREAKRPVVLAGNGVIRRQAADSLAEFAHRVKVPVVTTFMGKGALDYRDQLALPAIGLYSPDAPPSILAAADLVLAVGYDLVEWTPSVWNRTAQAIVHVDSTAAELDVGYVPAIEVVGEIGESLRALAEGFSQPVAQWDWQRFRPATGDLDGDRGVDTSFPVRPSRLMRDLRVVLGDEDIVISDVGVHKLWLATHFQTARPNTVVIPNGLASMGLAVPGAVAAKLVHPDRNVVAVTGDGGFLMNSQELETAKRAGTAFVVVVLVDNRYGIIELNQKRRFGRAFGVAFENPDFVAYAQSFGLPAFAVERTEDLEATLRRAIDLKAPTVIAVPVDSSQSPAALL